MPDIVFLWFNSFRMAEYHVFKGGFSVEEIVWIIGVFAALWGLMDVLRRITLAITVEKHIKHQLFLIMDDSDDPWFAVRGIKERAGLCGLLKKDCIAVIWNGSGGKKMEDTKKLCERTGVVFCVPGDVEILVKNIYNNDNDL